MSDVNEALEKVRAVAERGKRYRVEAYLFTLAAVTFSVHKHAAAGQRSHITGQQLLAGMRDMATERYGYLARTVFELLGVYRTEDFGEIVFELIEANLLSKQDTDTKQDFSGGYIFRDAFEVSYSA